LGSPKAATRVIDLIRTGAAVGEEVVDAVGLETPLAPGDTPGVGPLENRPQPVRDTARAVKPKPIPRKRERAVIPGPDLRGPSEWERRFRIVSSAMDISEIVRAWRLRAA
jgi:hypothetical protein